MPELATDTATGDLEPSQPGVLGVGMAHRARTQTVLGQHWSPSGLIGAVGRASVGFGLAVGRSRSIRPTVRYDDLNSAALRPSHELWRMRRDGRADDDIDATVAGPVPGPATADRETARSARPRQADAASPVVRRAQPTRRRTSRHARDHARPTWTDQIIQRSAVGFVAPAPASPGTELAVPAGFVPSGDPKLDRLRLMMGGNSAGTDARGADRVAPTAAARTTTNPAAFESPGPGRLARSMRPESALAGSLPATLPNARAAGTTPSSVRPGSDSVVDRGVDPEGVPARQRSARRSDPVVRRRAAEPSKVDRLRAMLVEQGLLTPDAPGGAGPETGRAGDRETGRGAGPETGDHHEVERRRAADPGSARPSSSPTPSSPTSSSPTSPGGTRRASGDPSVSDRVTTNSADIRRTLDDRNTAPPHRREPHTDRGPAARQTPTPTPEQRASSSSDDHSLTASAVAVATSPTAARELREQRLMRTGLAPQRDTVSTVAPRDGAGDRSMPDEYRLQDGPASSMVDAGRLPMAVGAVATTASVDPIATATLPVVSRGVPVQRHGAAPTLMSAGSTAPTTVIRRVTLPRALSVQHRPDSSFASHTVSTPGRPPRPSVVTVAEASAPRGSSAVTMLQRSEAPVGPALHDAVEVGRLTASERTAPLGVASVDTVRPSRARSLVPPGTGALLEVVRRSAQPLTSASEQPSRSTPMAPQLGVDPIAVAPRASRRGAQQPQPTAEVTTPTDVVDGSTTDAMVGATRRARPAEQVADQFMTALSETIRRRPAPLPTTFRPMADAIAGPRPVMLSTDSASRRALRSVGKVAATTGDTIHLDDRAIPAARLAEVMAHELTHIAHPSPTPRFFDDIDDSPEERRAERIAKVMARSPLAPAASVAAPPGRDLDRTIRRKATTTRTATSAPTGGASSAGGVTAEQLAAQFSGSATSTRPSASDVIRRTPAPAATGPNVIRRALESPEPNAHAHESVVESTSEDFLDAFRQHLPTIMNLIEDRMIIELERRGGRTWGSL